MFAKAAITGTLQAGGPTFTAEYLVVAGGGGGGYGGGGAGGYRSSVTGELSGGGASAESALSIALGTPYTVTVGAGGAAGTANGANSVLASITATGGGQGANGQNPITATGANTGNGSAGGSGGGGGHDGPNSVETSGGAGVTAQGFAGGGGYADSSFSPTAAGGGGGAGAVGQTRTSPDSTGGSGGIGVQSSVTGSAVYRAGGGGGAYSGTGGTGGGGNGGTTTTGLGGAGSANTGGGGGGANCFSTVRAGAGGSGVVIIRVPSTVVAEFSAGVVYNYIPTDDFNVYEVTAAGASDTVTFSQGAVTTVGESLRFNDDDSAYLSRTPASAGNTNVFTYSGWIKLGNVDTGQKTLLSAGPDNNNRSDIWVWGNKVYFYNRVVGTTYTAISANALLRDPSAWYHIVVKVDQTKSFVDIYINGVKQETTVTSANYGVATLFNTTNAHAISRLSAFASSYFDGYMSDVYFIDGEALDPSRFGKQDADGIWQPISYTGTYGTNGFHLDFADNSTAAALGTDTSGNGNDWTPSGITTDDQVTDTPSVNYATLNPIKTPSATLSNGNLSYVGPGPAGTETTFTTIGMQSGKWYAEYVRTGGIYTNVGLAQEQASVTQYLGQNTLSWSFNHNGQKVTNNSSTAYGTAPGIGDVIGIAFDADAGTLEFYVNNVAQGIAFSGLTSGPYFFGVGSEQTEGTFNFGQRPFAYTPPTGFQALNSSNLPAPAIADGKEHFQPALYTGNGTSQTVRGLEFQPDFVWIKDRNIAYDHQLLDAIRGATNELESNTPLAEFTNVDGLTAFNANGFTVGADIKYNRAGDTYVAWNWNAGGSTVTNTDGTITSQVRANTDAGFSIVTFTGTTSNQSVGHGLGATPTVFIVKSRVSAFNWWYYTTQIDGSMDYLVLNGTNAAANGTQSLPTSSVFYQNQIDSSVAYCFAEVDGFSKFGTYTGNGSTDGPFVYTGFRPAFLIIKKSSAAASWAMHDTTRAPYNSDKKLLYPDLSNAEAALPADTIDELSNGFKLRTTSSLYNTSGATFIFMAFAENPFKTARAR